MKLEQYPNLKSLLEPESQEEVATLQESTADTDAGGINMVSEPTSSERTGDDDSTDTSASAGPTKRQRSPNSTDAVSSKKCRKFHSHYS